VYQIFEHLNLPIELKVYKSITSAIMQNPQIFKKWRDIREISLDKGRLKAKDRW
jgi:hypothetical protein